MGENVSCVRPQRGSLEFGAKPHLWPVQNSVLPVQMAQVLMIEAGNLWNHFSFCGLRQEMVDGIDG